MKKTKLITFLLFCMVFTSDAEAVIGEKFFNIVITASIVIVVAKYLRDEVRDYLGTSSISRAVDRNMESIRANGELMVTQHRETMSGINRNGDGIENNGMSLDRIEERLTQINQNQSAILNHLGGSSQQSE